MKKEINIQGSLEYILESQMSRQVVGVDRPRQQIQDTSLSFTPLKPGDQSKYTASMVSMGHMPEGS